MSGIDAAADQPAALPASAPPATAPSATERRLGGGLLVLLCGLAALGALATNIILPVLPSIAGDLGVPTPQVAATLSGFFAAFAAGQLLAGPLSDRFGRVPVVLAGAALFVAGCAVCAMAPSLAAFTAGRSLQALGACAALVQSRAMARDLFDGAALARALALTMVAAAAAPGFSPLLGGLVDRVLGWRSVFVLLGALALGLAVLHARRVGETLPPDRRSALTATVIAGTYGSVAGDGRFLRPAAAVGLLMGGLYAYFTAAPAVLMDSGLLSAGGLGLFFATTVFVFFAGGFLAPPLSRRWGQRPVALAGFAVATTGGLILPAAGDSPGLVAVGTAIALFLFGAGLANPLGTALALHPFGRTAGSASALLGFLQMSCAAVASVLATTLPAAPATALGMVLAGGAALGAVALGMPVRQPSPAQPHATD